MRPFPLFLARPELDGSERRISNQDDVRVGVTAQYAKTPSIGRPSEVENLLRIKRGDLAAGRTIERLHPNIVYAVLADRVSDGFSIRRKVQASARDTLICIHETGF